MAPWLCIPNPFNSAVRLEVLDNCTCEGEGGGVLSQVCVRDSIKSELENEEALLSDCGVHSLSLQIFSIYV